MNDIKIVVVHFANQDGVTGYKDYSYFTTLDLEVDDLVVCEAKDFFGICRVVKAKGLTKQERRKASRWVVCKIDTAYLEAEKERLELINDIRAELAEEKQKYEDRMVYEMLAKDNPKIKKLLDKFDKLQLTE